MKFPSNAEPLAGSPPRVGAGTTASAPAHDLLLAVAEVSHELAARGDIERRVTQAMRVLEYRLRVQRSVLYFADAERRILQVQAAYGAARDQFRARYGTGVAGRVAESGQPVIVPVVRHDPMALSELSDLARWHELEWNLIAVPIAAPGRPAGALCAYFRDRDPGGFGDRLAALELIAALMWKAASSASSASSAPVPRALPEDDAPNRKPDALFEYSNLVGASAVMRQVYEQTSQVARTNATALLRGESGTGKELIARAIHDNSPRAAMPFVKVNCAALPEPLFESELFGHERGAFTGAHTRKKGRFELAQGGTLLLDEIGELSLTTQAKLLRVLQFREFERVGGTQTLHTDVRLVAATNTDMERAVREGTFREDLYYRINIFSITLPPLRDRRADIPALAEYFLDKLGTTHGRRIGGISGGALDLLTAHDWPGNVRELENAIERAIVVCDGFVIQERHLPAVLRGVQPAPERMTLSRAVDQLEQQMIEEALRSERGSIAAAARVLGTTERILRYKAQRLGIDPALFRV